MIVCPAMVSIFSVGLIAVDRYIYILHGLYYQRWFNTTKVRIGILCIWVIGKLKILYHSPLSKLGINFYIFVISKVFLLYLIFFFCFISNDSLYFCIVLFYKFKTGYLIYCIFPGITLGFLPITGWVNTELRHSRCFYIVLFPGGLILVNSLLSIIPIILVGVLYSIILVKALKNVKKIKDTLKIVDSKNNKLSEMRINRGNVNLKKSAQSVKMPCTVKTIKLRRSVSFNGSLSSNLNNSKQFSKLGYKSKSIDGLDINKLAHNNVLTFLKNNDSPQDYESNFSIQSINSFQTDQSISTSNINSPKRYTTRNLENKKYRNKSRVKEPNKWRAIIIVMLTSGSFIFTWMPFFITAIFFVFCQEKLTNPKCMHLRMMLSGPIATLAFLNSILNPLIYAWWHKGFQRSIRTYFRKHLQKIFRKDILK